MRVSDKMISTQLNQHLRSNRSQLSEYQSQAATLKRVTKPSDDPVAATRVIGARVDLRGTEQYLKNLDYSQSFMQSTDQSLQEMTENLMRVKELALSQADDAGANETTRRVTAAEVGQIYQELVKIANKKFGDRYIFGGYKTQEAPFELNGNYKGDQGEMLVHVDKNSFVAMNVPGSKIFLGQGLSRDGISHATARQPETLEELDQQLAEIESAEAEKEQQASLRGPASLRTPQVAADPSVTPEETLLVERMEDENGVDVFQVVKRLEVALAANDKYSVQDTLEDLDQAIDQVVFGRAQVGSRSAALINSRETLEKGKVDSNGQISNLEDADMFDVVSGLNKQETTLQATLKTGQKVMQPSLLDFLR